MGWNFADTRLLRFGLCRGVVMLLFAVAISAAAGCAHCANNDILDRVETQTINSPSEALATIAMIDAEALHREGDIARYAVLRAEALYHAGMKLEGDSLLLRAVDYYHARRDDRQTARALFYYGNAAQISGELTKAMWAFMEADEHLEGCDDNYLEGLVQRAKGDIYGAGCLYRNGYDCYARSKECFALAGCGADVAYADYDLGRLALAMRDYEAAEHFLASARDYALAIGDCDFLPFIIFHLGELYVQQGEYERCAEALALYEHSGCTIYDPSHYYSLMAVIEATRGNRDAAFEHIESAEAAEPRNDHLISYAHYSVNRIIGNEREALHWLERTNQRQDSTILQVLEQPVLNYQIGRLQSDLESKEREAELRNQRDVAIYLTIAIIATLLTGFLYHRVKSKNRAIQHYIEAIHELQLTKSNSSQMLTNAVSQLYRDRLSDINRLCETYYDHSDTSRHATKVFEQVRATIESIKSDKARLDELEDVVNSCRDGLMSKLREQCPKLNERERRVALYSYAGFSSRAICIFVESNPVALSKIKYRIKTKIKESGCEDADLLISAITDC